MIFYYRYLSPIKLQKVTMAKKIIDTNPHLRTKKDRIERVARSQSASQGIEGIKISPAKIKEMLNKREKSKSTE